MNTYKVATSVASVIRFRFTSPPLIRTQNSYMLRAHLNSTKTQNKVTFTTTVVRENPKKPIRAKGSSHQRIYKEAEPYYLDTFQTPKESKRKTYSPFVTRILVRLGKLLGYYDLPVQAIRVTREMYQMCALRLDENREFFIDTCGLPDSFQTWFQITLLHVWMLMVRFRPENDGKIYMQQLVNHLFDDAEWRMREIHGITSGSLISHYMKDYLSQFHGAVMAYDEGLCKDDPVLATALWRNVLVTEGSAHNMACLVKYVRQELQALDKIPLEKLAQGLIRFSVLT